MPKSVLKTAYLKARSSVLRPMLLLRRVKKLPKVGIRSILFLRHDRIGDMVLSTAALKALRRAYPHAKITVLASKRNRDILQHNPNIDQILIYKGIMWFFSKVRPRSYDLVIDPFLTYELRQAFMTYLAGGKYRIGFERAGREIFFNLKGPVVSSPTKMVDYLLDLVEAAGGKREGCVPEVFVTDGEQEWASEILSNKGIDEKGKIVAIHPGGYYPSQRWPAERFGLLAKRIANELQENVIVFVGHGEDAILAKIKQLCGNEVHIISNISIRQLMAILSKCNLFLGNNSGPLHIAAALGLPTISIIGPQVIPLWLPYGNNHIVLRKNLNCSPCYKGVCEDHSCMKLISIKDFFKAVESQVVKIKLN